MNPEIEWLQRRWNLPDRAIPSVRRLLAAETDGGTAVELGHPPEEFGDACGGAADATPLVRVEAGGRWFLQSRRLHDIEAEIARRISVFAGSAPLPDATVRDSFPDSPPDDPQRRAAEVALERRLTIITGGPGTGKTFTLARILALLTRAGVPPERVRLAAPTGKAADRMRDAITRTSEGSPSIAASAGTLHALLGIRPGGAPRFDARARLPCDVLIVDECSMIDAFLCAATLRALPDDARLILLGDPNQLESVGIGSPFAAMVRFASAPASPLAPNHVHLRTTHRFRDQPGIFRLADAIERRDADAAADLLSASRSPDAPDGLAWIPPATRPAGVPDFPKVIVDALANVAQSASPEAALAAMRGVCILTAQREYFVGALAISAAVDAALATHGVVRNRPIIINRNDPETGLRNGNVGIIHLGNDGEREAWFDGGGDDKPRRFPIGALPDFSSAWAITIHRSQGSEYDHVLVILPREDSPLATRELIYTAITRARKSVHLLGGLDAVRAAVRSEPSRITLLGSALHTQFAAGDTAG